MQSSGGGWASIAGSLVEHSIASPPSLLLVLGQLIMI